MKDEDENVDYDNLTKRQKKAIAVLDIIEDFGGLDSNFYEGHSEYSTVILEISKIIK